MNLLDTPDFESQAKILFIRPFFQKNNPGVLPDTLALCTTNGAILVDEQVLAHFPSDTSGKDIKAEALETWGVTADNVKWGELL